MYIFFIIFRMKPVIQRLFLAAPIEYPRSSADPFTGNGYFNKPEPAENEELIYCFTLNPEQAMEFEPDEKNLINSFEPRSKALPQGYYLFCQEEGSLEKERILYLTVELQKEALWQRLKPDNRFYIRYLREEDRIVTQVFRPYSTTVSTI